MYEMRYINKAALPFLALQSELNGSTKLTYESICQARFSALVSMRVPIKRA